MDAQSLTSDPKIVTGPPTFLPASEDGPTPSSWLAGTQLEMFGQDPALANHFQSQGKILNSPMQSKTSEISGLSGYGSSPSTALQLSLESRLRANLDVNGSLESELTWKHWDMLSGPQICALRASTRHTEDNDFTGWPTPDTVAIGDGTDFETQRQNLLTRRERTRKAVKEGKTKAGSGRSMSLQMAAQSTQGMIPLTGWSTPCVVEPSTTTPRPSRAATGRNTDYLGRQVHQVRDLWPTPVADGDRTTNYAQGGTSLGYAARSISETFGTDTTSPSAPRSMAQPGLGVLNPELCRWLMGFPRKYEEGLSKDTGPR